MSKQKIILLEILWVITALIIAAIFIFPIYYYAPNYSFLAANAVCIFVFVTYTRLMFFVNTSFLTWHTGIKLGLILVAVPIIFKLIEALNNFTTYLDYNGSDAFFGYLPDSLHMKLDLYMRNEYVFFNVAAILSSVIFPIFLIVSIWRKRNQGKHI